MLQGERVVLKGRMEIGLGEMAGVARLRKEGQISQLQIRDHQGDAFDGRTVGPPLKMGMDEHQAQKQQARGEQGEAEARLSNGNPGLCRFLPEESFNQGF